MRCTAGAAGALTAAAGAQGLYLQQQYRRLPEARGPLSGVALWRMQRRRSSSAAPADAAASSASGEALAPRRPGTVRGGGGGGDRRSCRTILFIGDSLVTGVGCSAEAGDGPVLPRSAAEALAARLGRDVSWAAIGETGADVPMLQTKMLPSVRAEVQRCARAGERVDHVVVMCGLNDIKACFLHVQPWRHPGAYRRAMGELAASIREAAGPQCRVWFPELPLEPAPRFRGIPPLSNLVHTVASLWERQKRQLADGGAPGVGVVDANVARVRMDWYCDDGMHPNDLGYREWGEIIADTIVEVAHK